MKSKWIAVVLVVSLALNLALGGFLLGRASGMGPAADPTHMFPRWARSLPEPRREAVRPLIREYFTSVRPNLRQLREQRRVVHQAIRAEPFDAQVLEDALAEMRGLQDEIFMVSDQSFVRFVAQLDPAERAQLANRPHRKPPPPGKLGPH
ncbi:MAG: periplasmic heavy metal sensor [Pseudomonadota bacterium]